MEPIFYLDRKSGKLLEEKVYEAEAIKFLYGNSRLSKLLGTPLMHLTSKFSLFSALYGWSQTLSCTRKKIAPFIEKFEVDPSEFLENVQSFSSFNDFFIRKLKPESRPITPGPDKAVIPADGRYLFYPNVDLADGFVVKGKKFRLASLLDDEKLAEKYSHGTMIIARLCPSDYHRYHFPCDCVPMETRMINGRLFSVNPIAIKKNINIFTQNKRTLCELHTDRFGKVLVVAVGATCVGSIHETYTPYLHHVKGSEMGYFSFGGSSLILLFPPDSIRLDPDLAQHHHTEIRCLLGQSLGQAAKQL